MFDFSSFCQRQFSLSLLLSFLALPISSSSVVSSLSWLLSEVIFCLFMALLSSSFPPVSLFYPLFFPFWFPSQVIIISLSLICFPSFLSISFFLCCILPFSSASISVEVILVSFLLFYLLFSSPDTFFSNTTQITFAKPLHTNLPSFLHSYYNLRTKCRIFQSLPHKEISVYPQ